MQKVFGGEVNWNQYRAQVERDWKTDNPVADVMDFRLFCNMLQKVRECDVLPNGPFQTSLHAFLTCSSRAHGLT